MIDPADRIRQSADLLVCLPSDSLALRESALRSEIPWKIQLAGKGDHDSCENRAAEFVHRSQTGGSSVPVPAKKVAVATHAVAQRVG